MLIATLIAAGRLDDRLLQAAVDRVDGARFLGWIDEGDAADISVEDATATRAALEGWESVDVVVQPYRHRRKRLLVADMDSTVIGQECIDELADYAGIKPQVAEITERAMRGELDFAAALKERVALLEGLDSSVIQTCLADRIRPNPGAKTLIRTLRLHGVETILVSGGFTAFVQPIAETVGFERFEANELEVQGGKLTGRVEGRVVDSAVKRQTLVEARERLGIDPGMTLAIGDGANDIAMVGEAGLGVAYRAKQALAEVADARLDHHGLDALLWAADIGRRHWVVEG